MKIAIISPGHLASNPRVVKEAAALQEIGYEITIIHGQSVAWLVREDLAVADTDWHVIAVPFGRQCAGLLAHVVQVCRMRVASLLLEYCSFPEAMSLQLAAIASSPVTQDLSSSAKKVYADLYIAHYVPALPAAAAAASTHLSQYAFDAEDFHLGDLPDTDENQHRREIICRLEQKHLPAAVYVTSASPGIASALKDEYSVESTVVLNTFSRGLVTEKSFGQSHPEHFSVYWFSQTVGPDRGLESAVRALALTKTRVELFLRGNVNEHFRLTLTEIARECEVEDRVHFLDTAPPSQMVALCSDYDVGLVSETGHSQNRQIALTNKQFTYMLAGLPSVMSDVPAHVQFAATAGDAVCLYQNGSAASLAETLDRLFSSGRNLMLAQQAAWKLGQEIYNWECEQTKLTAVVAASLGLQ